MSTDIRLKDSFLDHPKTKKLRSRLGESLDDWRPVIALLRLWQFAAKHHPRGDLSSMEIDDIELAADWHGQSEIFVQTLVEIGFIDEKNSKRLLHDWKEHNPYAYRAPERKARAKRAAAKRWKDAKGNAKSMQPALLNDAKSNAPLPAPDPSPAPDPDPVPVGTGPAKLIEEMQYGHNGFFQNCLGSGQTQWIKSYFEEFPDKQIKSAMDAMVEFYKKNGLPPPARSAARMKLWEWTAREVEKKPQAENPFDIARREIFGEPE